MGIKLHKTKISMDGSMAPGDLKIPRRTKDNNTLDSAITGSRPDKRKRAHTFESDLLKYISLKDLSDSVYYRGIELFYPKDPQSKRDVSLCYHIVSSATYSYLRRWPGCWV
ncbi:Pc22g03340 [Penicillium rubens Wisconsin 54-1255]|uniref:Pc22g03340 protein n=1 Tax=Penicillium rubens (strain ATCC 28089 / DSM 1075 / NRRL 1951 / Wisconsin 54-1255) TaxID=500485 RepID=B6HRC3_PENRW|nr:Pc22g03340 [Penicillium rubens Wisconsin 54-1255]